jgi:hypothetical protein
MGCLALAGCDQSTSEATASTTAATNEAGATSAVTSNPLAVDSSTVAAVVARPEHFLAAYFGLGGSSALPNAAAGAIKARLGTAFASLSNSGALATYASAVAFNVAPLGPTSVDPMNGTLSQLLGSPALTCGHFCKLATLFSFLGNARLNPSDTDAVPDVAPRLHFLVWTGTVPLQTGFHSQLVLKGVLQNAYLLLDPTYAYALRIPHPPGGPDPNLSVIENAATMLQTPLSAANLAVLDPRGTAAMPQMLDTVLSGALGPQYVYHDSIYGCEGWDARIARIINNFG